IRLPFWFRRQPVSRQYPGRVCSINVPPPARKLTLDRPRASRTPAVLPHPLDKQMAVLPFGWSYAGRQGEVFRSAQAHHAAVTSGSPAAAPPIPPTRLAPERTNPEAAVREHNGHPRRPAPLSCVRDARAREAAWPLYARSCVRDARARGLARPPRLSARGVLPSGWV